MENEQYKSLAQYREKEFYAIIIRKTNNEKVFEQKCVDLNKALQIADQEFNKLKDKN